MKYLALFLLVVVFHAGAAIAAPHQEGQSYIFLKIYDDRIEGRVEIRYPDLLLALGLPPTNSGGLDATRAYVEANADSIKSYVKNRLEVVIGGIPVPYEVTRWDVLHVGLGDFVQLHFQMAYLSGRPESLDIRYSGIFDADPNHRAFVVIEHYWRQGTFANESGGALLMTPDAPYQTVDLSESSIWHGFVAMVSLGIWHIWVGIDHILFLLALLLPAVLRREEGHWIPVDRFRDALWNVFKIVTMFTLAHTVTLSLAALDVIRLPSSLVESVIAASIALVALHNIYPVIPGRDWMIAFGFGLFHGFGFASVLGHLGLGAEHAALSLLGFNLGVEIGQTAIVFIAFPLLFLARKRRWYLRFLVIGSWLLIGIAAMWFVERAFDVPISKYLRRYYRRGLHKLGF